MHLLSVIAKGDAGTFSVVCVVFLVLRQSFTEGRLGMNERIWESLDRYGGR